MSGVFSVYHQIADFMDSILLLVCRSTGSRNIKKNAFDLGGRIPFVRDKRINLFKGLFEDTLSEFLRAYNRKNTLVVHIDADLYSSALFVLVSLHSYFRNGDIIIFDDFQDPLGEFRAFSDYCQAFRVKPKIISAVKYGSFFDKAAFTINNFNREKK